MPFFLGHNRERDFVSVWRPDRAKAIVAWNVFEDCDFAAREIGDGNVAFGTGPCLRVSVCVERQSSGVRRNVRQRSGRDLFCIAAVEISDPDIVAALESDFSLCSKRGRSNGQKQRNANYESSHMLTRLAT